jgi:hypothetical protein
MRRIPDHSAFSRARNERFRKSDIFRSVFERVVGACIRACMFGRLKDSAASPPATTSWPPTSSLPSNLPQSSVPGLRVRSLARRLND